MSVFNTDRERAAFRNLITNQVDRERSYVGTPVATIRSRMYTIGAVMTRGGLNDSRENPSIDATCRKPGTEACSCNKKSNELSADGSSPSVLL